MKIPNKTCAAGTLLMKANLEWLLEHSTKLPQPIIIYTRGRFRQALITGGNAHFVVCRYLMGKDIRAKIVCVPTDNLYEEVDKTIVTLAEFCHKEGGKICNQSNGGKHWIAKNLL